MKFSQNGWDFDSDTWLSTTANEYCKFKKIDAVVFVATHQKTGERNFVMFDYGGTPIFESKQFEAIGVHIDMMAAEREIK